ncbi:MAG: alpha/beta hydrolase [Solirubrobacterales bacterium]|nr:alpha/beta hydrolase [Solirubrobacterales bacterium]
MRLPHDEAGSGPALVLIHAGIADRTMWREHLAPLASAGYRAVAVDLPGFGEAPPPEHESAPWNDVLETMTALGLDQAVLVGNSFGGAVALRVAVVAPERVAALALISAPPHDLDPSPELTQIWEAEETALERGDIEAAVTAVVAAWTQPDAPPELKRRVAEMQRRAFTVQAGADPVDEAPDPVEEDPARLTRLDLPTLVAAGEKDLVEFREGAERLAHTLPRARHVRIPGAGHLAPMETPDAFRELLLGFLAE